MARDVSRDSHLGSGGGVHVGRRKQNTSGSRLNAREMVVARDMSRRLKGSGGHVGRRKQNTSDSRLNAREVVVARYVSRRIEKSGCGSHLDARDVVVGSMLEEGKKTPPARV